ncbi:uncharacterized protein LOC134276330 [Saccostrea cucullata]|uniref:uncharacterized protein LOC134276330 n=1 Tax=Saccostrea cuccullata TaxID=36930 RepID=UPI002ED0F2A8
MYDDVVIYRERYDYIPQQEDIKTTYITNPQQYRKKIDYIRSVDLYRNWSLLAGIKTDLKMFPAKLRNHLSEMATKAHRLKDQIDTVACDVKIRYKQILIQRLQQLVRKMNERIAFLENYENISHILTSKPVKFILFNKKTPVPNGKAIPNLSLHTFLSLNKKTNMGDVIKLLSDFQIIEIGKRHVKSENLLELMSSPMIHRYVEVPNVIRVNHVSCVTPDRVWISDINSLIFMNRAGDILDFLTDINNYGAHTVDIRGDLIYIDWEYNINKISVDNGKKISLMKKKEPWRSNCIYCNPSDGNLLVGMYNTDTFTSKVNRYNDEVQEMQTILYNSGQKLYGLPIYITENCNGDVIVSDYFQGVVVTKRDGGHRFSYTGRPSESGLRLFRICTDAVSHILVCDGQTVQVIDKDGRFLTFLPSKQQEINLQRSLSYDDKTHLLWIGTRWKNTVYLYRYIKRQELS